MAAGSGWVGVKLLVEVAEPVAGAVLSATYGAAPGTPGGLRLITALTGEPPTRIKAPTSRDLTLTPNRTEERKKYYAGSEDGIQLETAAGVTGSLSITLARDAANKLVYEASADLLLAKSSSPGSLVYIATYRAMDFVSPTLYRYHFQAGLFTAKTDGADQTDAVAAMRNFTLASSGDFINGYRDITV